MTSLSNPDLEILAERLAAAQAESSLILPPAAAQTPRDVAEAYRVQQRVLALRAEAVAGWKVGARSPREEPHAAPLPASGVVTAPAQLPHALAPTFGLELELAFRLDRRFEPRPAPYTEAEVLDSIGSVMAAIELVSSRQPNWPGSSPLIQLADLQNHLALVVGDAVPYDRGAFFESLPLLFEYEGHCIASGPCRNPAGDPRRLLPWLVNHACAQGQAIGPEQVLTTGSYTGLYFPETAGHALAEIEGLPPVSLRLV